MKNPPHLPTTILTLLNLISSQHPQKTALVFENQNINYEDLNLQSNKLANYLNTKGDFLDIPICFSLEQSIDKVIVMLAIWKATGAYVSLNPLYPETRLKYIINDTNSPILITTKALSPKFNYFNKEIILIDDLEEAKSIKENSDEELPENGIYDGLAYLTYNSETSDSPKAIITEHRGLINFVKYFNELLDSNLDDKTLNISSSNFDSVVLDLWIPLSLGLTVHLYPNNNIDNDVLLDFNILNNQLIPVPSGEIGELHIGGIQVLPDYLNQPKLNTERFIYYTNSSGQKKRVFKTGNLVRMTSNGNIEFISKAPPPQIKATKFKVELSENQHKLIEIFENQAKKTPDKVALSLIGNTISYKELHQKSNKIANQLIAMGIKNNEFVACYQDQSIERVISLLGIIKAGAAYVPLDTSHPLERINIILNDTNPSFLITTENQIDISKKVHIPVLHIEDMLSYISDNGNEKDSFTDTHTPSDLMYVIHTSGTTGKPKGVLIEHKSVSNFITEYGKLLEIDATDRTLQFSPYNFDGSIIDLWIPLTKGATIHLYPNNKLLGDSLSDFISLHNLTVIPYISPSVLSTIPLSITFPDLRVIGTGGEVCPIAIRNHWMHQVKLVNGYGPTEATVAVNNYVFDNSHPANTIGKPITNMKFYVLDRNMKEVPIGITGELYVSGIQLSRGYLNEPELTAEHFITNPFIKKEDNESSIYNRLYKTGDWVKILPDGMIEYIGREDHQIKIRGYRIEVSEIEKALQQIKGIKNVAIQMHKDSEDIISLRAFFTGKIKTTTIRNELSKKLPAYMIPSEIFAIEAIPVTANGKLDLNALSVFAEKNLEEQEGTIEQTESFIAPHTELQKQLAVLWKSFLKVKTVGIDDNFFHFGGNSILAYKLVSSIRKDLHIFLQISDLFLYPTINELENYIRTKEANTLEEDISVNSLEEPIKLSSQQQSLWFLDKLHGSLPYHISALYPVSNTISAPTLEKAFRLLMQRHGALRTIISEDENTAYQFLISSDNWMLQQIYKSDSLQKLIDIPFDLERDYMLRAYLIHESNQNISLFVVIHHIATDAWSMPLIINELNAIYLEILEKKKPVINNYPIQYRDYAHWQFNKTRQNKISTSTDFWKNYLQDVPVLQVAHDFPKQHLHSISGQQYHFTIHSQLASDLQKFSREQHATLYMTLLSAFGLLMQHYSGQNDICIGSPAANRTPHTVDTTIGYFVNMLPIRIKIDGNPIYTNFLEEIKKMLLTVFQHQEVPFETIINHAIKDRFAGYNPLFQTVFILQDAPEENSQSGPIDSNNLKWIYNGKSKFDLQFEVTPLLNGLDVTIEYTDALFKESTILQMAKDFQIILESIVKEPEKKIGDFEILLETHEQNEISELEEIQSEKTLVEMFEDQVKRNPKKTALRLTGMSITYKELHEKSNKIADQLIAMGIKKNEFVACYQDQSIERVISLLGIIKAGAAYVPLDTSYPIERINVIIKDTNPLLLITTEKRIDISTKVHLPVLDIEHMINYIPDTENNKYSYIDTHTPSDLIYVIHTSGTTGKPKGVLIEHKAVSNFIAEYSTLLEINIDDSTLQFSPYNFDGSIIDLWLPLTKGATVHLYPNNKLLGESLSDFISLHNITVVPFVSPSVLSTIPLSVHFPNLRVIGTGGEACPSLISKHWMHQLKLVNVYGPTETTVAVNEYVYDDKHPSNTLGKPIKNMKFYVLDRYMRKVPVGVIGELYISGIQLSRGYLNDPELTAERFITNPFIKATDKKSIYNRLYKTGDQVKVLPDGMIEYIGREDHQVKIRGYRIEISEIETALQQVNGIKNVAVQVHKASQDILSLRAFFTGEIKISIIKNELSKKLPAYMIPNEIFAIDAIPVTANGKLDMEALSLLAEKNLEEKEEEIPLNSYEEIIRDIWSDVLQRRITSLEDDFFHLGGHSLLLTKLYNRISKHYPNKISLSELYINNTVRKLALLIEERDSDTHVDQYGLGMDPLSDEIKKDAYLDPSEFNPNLENKGDFVNPKFILLTGVTGFVGANMLAEFLKTTTAIIYLLIRANNEKHAQERLLETLNDQLLPLSLYDKERVKLLPGDLSKPHLGLSPETYDALTQNIDVIYHAGSAVNFIQPYSYMKAANVDALRTVIHFATTSKLKQICLLSTIGVFSWEHHFTKPDLIMEKQSIESAFKYLSRDMGYAQSKWVMEKIAMQAIEQGIPIIIFRLGYAFCHSTSGATAKYQWWGLLVKTCVELKAYPILLEQKEELVSVDFISKAIAHISKNPKATGEIFHLSPAPKDNIPVINFFEKLRSEFDIELTPLPYHEWMNLWENDENSPLYPLLSLFKFKVYDNKSIIEIHQNTPEFDITNTLDFIKDSGIETTVVNREILEAYCIYLGILK
ncbi:amino acid adenylation domain-containing protein [Flavobacterium sp. F-65]|uniref:Amino acid adenylation domain-containing protein n=1 Tax=Flavobacterium pisciphilum TaxID=2893755 RepID=A0ABS8MPF0_9FLAO|nr:non-ribosomal peptide synthetase [Flavobacterium sp. F-65]MCC9070638.1 amino acid adenylation domain-containing protein [Flavobacterium sp. F-65]